MSTTQEEMNDKDFLSTYIKLENDPDEDLTDDKSLELNNKKDYFSNLSTTSNNGIPALSSAYKGKIEVTSKGRRKIFDGVRWQILCRRPECRKQTNKKSLCITHYKEEYESNTQSSSSWSNNLQSFKLPSYQQRHKFDTTKLRNEIEDQNNTISTTNITDNDEQLPFNSNKNRSINDMHNSRRFILKNSKWRPLCKYNTTYRNELTQQKRRDISKFCNNDNRRSHSSMFNNHRPIASNEITKRLKKTADYPISSSSVTEQFDINSNENNYPSNKPTATDFSSITSKLPGHEVVVTSSKNHLNILPSDKSSFNKQKSELTTDQSVQTDLTIPFCCIIHQEAHTFYSSCKSTSSISSYNTKPEPQSFDTNFST